MAVQRETMYVCAERGDPLPLSGLAVLADFLTMIAGAADGLCDILITMTADSCPCQAQNL